MNTNAEQKTYHITAIESSKGGVGKTTSTAMIAQILAISGQRVLIVDMDFQRNCTDMMSKNIEQVPEVSMRDLVLKDLTLEEVEKTIIPSKLENLDIVPTCEDIESLHYDLYDEVNHNENANAIMCFRNNLLQIAGTKYDHIVIDCSPAITTLSSALGIACDTILCPIEADNFGYQSVVKIVNMAAEIDMDFQRNCTDMMSKNIEQVPEVSMRDLVLKDLTLEEVEKTIIPSKLENLDIVPTCEDIESLHYDLYDEVNHNENANAIMCFRNNLLQIAGTKYDHIVIDCSPAITTLSSALGIACDTILCPIEADNFGYQSVVKIVNMAAEIETYYELHEKKKAYVFMTKVKSRTNRAKDMFAGYAEMLNDMFLPTPIRMSEVLAKSSTDFVPLMLSPNKRNECVNDYMDLLKAIDYLDGRQFIKVRKFQNGTNSKKKTNKKSTKKGANKI